MKVYALNLFNVADKGEYLAYSKRSAREVQAHGGRVVALGRWRESLLGEIEPRQVLILVEWTRRKPSTATATTRVSPTCIRTA